MQRIKSAFEIVEPMNATGMQLALDLLIRIYEACRVTQFWLLLVFPQTDQIKFLAHSRCNILISDFKCLGPLPILLHLNQEYELYSAKCNFGANNADY